jgi:hypothetical protein
MSGKGSNNSAKGGAGGGRSHGRGKGMTSKGNGTPKGTTIIGTTTKHNGEEKLGDYVFTYGTLGAQDQMRQSWKQIIIFVGKEYSGHMQAELQEQTRYIIPEPEPTKSAQDAYNATTAAFMENEHHDRDRI